MDYKKCGSGPLLIYLPGMEGTGELFFQQLPDLEKHYSVVCVRFRSVLPFTYDDLVNDVLKIVDTEGAPDAIIIGESFGGTVALQFAVQFPHRVKHLILASTFPFFRKRWRLAFVRMLLPLAFTKPGAWFYRRIASVVLRMESVDGAGIRKLLECSFSHGKAAAKRRLDLIAEHDVRDRLSNISFPVTFIAGKKDKLVSAIFEAEEMNKKIRSGRLVILPESGHTCLISKGFSLLPILQKQEGA